MTTTATMPARQPADARWRGVAVLVATVVGMALTARLGIWQLDRAHRKEALQEALDGRGAMRPLSAGELATKAADVPPQLYRRIQIQGRWLPGSTVYLDNRAMDGQPGFYVVSVLQPCCDWYGDPVAVQRGWVPRSAADRTALPPVVTPSGIVDVTGHVAPAPSQLFDFAGPSSSSPTPGRPPGPIRQNIELDPYGAEHGVTLRPLSIVQEPVIGAADDGLRRNWPRPATNTYKHYGYAGQWFAFSGLMAALYVWYQWWLPHRRRHGA